MSLDDTENTIRNKIMDILEEELSALKLKETDKHKEDYDTDENHLDGEENADKESFSSSSDTTADLLKEVDSQHSEGEYEVSEVLNLPSKNVVEEIQRPIKYQHQERELIHQEKATNKENDKSAEILDTKICDRRVGLTNEEHFTPPPDSLAEKIKQRAESYFEDYNLFKNSFLLSHIQRNKKGYVSLKLMTSLRKIKSLTRDFRVVAYSLKKSKILELNSEEDKIRRIEPIPKTEDTSFGKTLMVFNLPTQNLSPDSLRDMFSKFGTVVSAGVYEIDSPASDIYHERCLYFHRKIASKIYGIVEYEEYDAVVETLKDEDGHLPKENEVKAVPLLPQIYKKEKRYLKFLKPYNTNPRRGYDRFRPRNDFYGESTSSGDIRNEKRNMRGGYTGGYYKRGYFPRSYRGRKYFMPSSTHSFEDDYFPREWNQPFRGLPKKWEENRHLRASNSFNTDRLYPNAQRTSKRSGYGYYE